MSRKIMAVLAGVLLALGGVTSPAAAGALGSGEPLPKPATFKKLTYGQPTVGSQAAKDAPREPKGRQLRAVSCSGNPDGTCHNYVSFYQYITAPDAITGFGIRQQVAKPTLRIWDAATCRPATRAAPTWAARESARSR